MGMRFSANGGIILLMDSYMGIELGIGSPVDPNMELGLGHGLGPGPKFRVTYSLQWF